MVIKTNAQTIFTDKCMPIHIVIMMRYLNFTGVERTKHWNQCIFVGEGKWHHVAKKSWKNIKLQTDED